jgi:hypothetical protein
VFPILKLFLNFQSCSRISRNVRLRKTNFLTSSKKHVRNFKQYSSIQKNHEFVKKIMKREGVGFFVCARGWHVSGVHLYVCMLAAIWCADDPVNYNGLIARGCELYVHACVPLGIAGLISGCKPTSAVEQVCEKKQLKFCFLSFILVLPPSFLQRKILYVPYFGMNSMGYEMVLEVKRALPRCFSQFQNLCT